jgi:FtsP/CotA-like multicopper oxidase with cupredoxin domain
MLMKLLKILFLAYTLVNVQVGIAKTISQDIFINVGLFTTVNKTTFPMWNYNTSDQFKPQSLRLKILIGDTLIITIHNNDNIVHAHQIKGKKNILTLLPNATTSDTIIGRKEEILAFYDPLNFPTNKSMGLSGMISIEKANNKSFYWNLQEFQMTFATAIADKQKVDWKTYYPDYFTINGLSNPDLQKDSSATIVGQVGDSIKIFILNTGQSKHSIHFHGFHCKVLTSSNNIIQNNSEKDTFPLLSMESVILLLIPDKLGVYSVHDHNLVAITGGSIHPNGMFTMMTIK